MTNVAILLPAYNEEVDVKINFFTSYLRMHSSKFNVPKAFVVK